MSSKKQTKRKYVSYCAAISKKGLTKTAIFKQNLNAEKFKQTLKLTIKPFANKHMLVFIFCFKLLTNIYLQ